MIQMFMEICSMEAGFTKHYYIKVRKIEPITQVKQNAENEDKYSKREIALKFTFIGIL